jgi:hypothetical protein
MQARSAECVVARSSRSARSGAWWAVAQVAVLAGAPACAGGIPQAELDRCRLGVADGNDAFGVRQGPACSIVAQRLVSADRPTDALGFARRGCQLGDARGCEQYLALVRTQPSLARDEVGLARAAGEKACAGLVVGVDGADARPRLCVRTAELYREVEPRSADDAARLYARACKLGDPDACGRAASLGAEVGAVAVAAKASTPAASAASAPAPAVSTSGAAPEPVARQAATALPGEAPTAPATAARSAADAPTSVSPCHDMRACAPLAVDQRNASEVVGTLVNRCDRSVACTWCPANGNQVDKSKCRSAVLAPRESRKGRAHGLWYDGFRAIAYDCADANDPTGCVAP